MWICIHKLDPLFTVILVIISNKKEKKMMKSFINRKTLQSAVIGLIVCTSITVAIASQSTFEDASKAQEINTNAAKQSQKKVDQLSDESQSLRNEYRQVLQAIENNKIYNQQLRDLIESQKAEMVQIDEDIEKIKDTTRNIAPLMTKMKDSLKEFVAYDLPFLKDEREKRIESLDELFVKSGVTVSERYRKTLEAYLVENEYGQTLEAYSDSVILDGTKVTADFLKVGRIALYYLTKDSKKGGIWDIEKKAWEPLSSSERNYVRTALKVALKQSSPSLLTLPIYKMATQPTLNQSTESNQKTEVQ